MKKLNLGSGKRPRIDADNLDIVKMDGVDIVWDCNEFPYPIKDNTYDDIEASDILEHLDDIVGVMEELYRIMKVGGRLFIRVPDGRIPEAIWADPTHKRGFIPMSFDYFCPSTYSYAKYGFYSNVKFQMLKIEERNKGIEYTMIKI